MEFSGHPRIHKCGIKMSFLLQAKRYFIKHIINSTTKILCRLLSRRINSAKQCATDRIKFVYFILLLRTK